MVRPVDINGCCSDGVMRTDLNIVRAAPRRKMAFQLRLQGLTYKEIGAELGININATRNLIVKELEELAKETKQLAIAYKEQNLQQLRALRDVYLVGALAGSHKHTDTLLKLMDREAKFLGLDAPVKQEVSIAQTQYDEMTLDQLKEEARKNGIPTAEDANDDAAPVRELEYRPDDASIPDAVTCDGE